MPQDIPDPHTVKGFKDGDRISLTGFIYQWRATNVITGITTEVEVNRIDVTHWKKGNELSYVSKQAASSKTVFKSENYVSCRA